MTAPLQLPPAGSQPPSAGPAPPWPHFLAVDAGHSGTALASWGDDQDRLGQGSDRQEWPLGVLGAHGTQQVPTKRTVHMGALGLSPTLGQALQCGGWTWGAGTQRQRWLPRRSAEGCRTHAPAPPSAGLPWSPQQQRPEPCRALSRDRWRDFQVPRSPHVTPGAGSGVIHPPKRAQRTHCPPSFPGTKGHGEHSCSAAERRSPQEPSLCSAPTSLGVRSPQDSCVLQGHLPATTELPALSHV